MSTETAGFLLGVTVAALRLMLAIWKWEDGNANGE